MSLVEEFAAACATRLALDADTTDLACKILERFQGAITESILSQTSQVRRLHLLRVPCNPAPWGRDLGSKHPLWDQDEENKRLWFACILYIARGLRQPPADRDTGPPGLTVAAILDAFDLRYSPRIPAGGRLEL